MRAVRRGSVAVPEAMTAIAGKQSAADLERVKITDYYDRKAHNPPKRKKKGEPKEAGPKFEVYKLPSVKSQLHELFHGKCAYCESFYLSNAPVDVEHYRPKGRVHEDAAHPGYWWIAMDWTNLLPSCIHCNRRSEQPTPVLSVNQVSLVGNGLRFSDSIQLQSGKQDSFPILGQRAAVGDTTFASEIPLLLDPTRDQPDEHLRFHIDRENLIGLVLPQEREDGGIPGPVNVVGARPELQAVVNEARTSKLSLKGAVSIHVYGLNRLSLVQERTRLLRQLEFLESLALAVGTMADELLPDPNHPRANDARDEGIAKRLFQLQDRVLEEMKRMARPEEPYSVMVQEWINGFKQRLRNSIRRSRFKRYVGKSAPFLR